MHARSFYHRAMIWCAIWLTQTGWSTDLYGQDQEDRRRQEIEVNATISNKNDYVVSFRVASHMIATPSDLDAQYQSLVCHGIRTGAGLLDPIPEHRDDLIGRPYWDFEIPPAPPSYKIGLRCSCLNRGLDADRGKKLRATTLIFNKKITSQGELWDEQFNVAISGVVTLYGEGGNEKEAVKAALRSKYPTLPEGRLQYFLRSADGSRQRIAEIADQEQVENNQAIGNYLARFEYELTKKRSSYKVEGDLKLTEIFEDLYVQ